jgi:hypothetical protein
MKHWNEHKDESKYGDEEENSTMEVNDIYVTVLIKSNQKNRHIQYWMMVLVKKNYNSN